MHSLMPAEAYIDEAWFARERELLMMPLWQFVAPRMLLDKPNAFVRRSICGVDVVVQHESVVQDDEWFISDITIR